MAITGVKNFQAGAILTAADLNTYNRGVFVFASAAARTSAFSSAGITLTEGWVSYLLDSNHIETYDGAAWVDASPVTSVFARTGAVVATAGDYAGIASGSVGVYNGTVASASAIAITGPGTYLLTGTTAVNTITGATVAGTVITLVASGQAARVCVVINNAATANAITLKNSQAVGLYSSDSITLVYNGSYWLEISRALKPVIDYVAVTATVNITGTTSAAPTTAITGNAVTFDGASAYRYEFFSPSVAIGTNNINVGLYEDGTFVSNIGVINTTPYMPWMSGVIRTPSAGSHTATIRAWVNAGTGTIQSGTGTGGTQANSYLRITREV